MVFYRKIGRDRLEKRMDCPLAAVPMVQPTGTLGR